MDITSNFSKEQLLNMFLLFYDTSYWINKTRTLQLLIENEDLLNIINQDEVLKNFQKEEMKRLYQYELYMTSFHSSEALFGLVFAFLFQKETPWIYLTEYRFEDFNKLIEMIKNKGLSSIIKEEDTPKFIQWLFFPMATKDNFKEFGKIEGSTDFIDKYLKKLAYTLSDKKDYNSFKHGFRGLPVRSTLTIQNKQTNSPLLESSGESCLYLDFDFKKENEVTKKILKIVTKTYSYKTAVNVIVTNTQLIRNIVDARKQIIVDKKTQINFSLFHDKTVNDIFFNELKEKPTRVLKFEIK